MECNVLLLFALLCFVSLMPTIQACKNYTFEACLSADDCAGSSRICVRAEGSLILTCTDGNNNDCLCAADGLVDPNCEDTTNGCPVLSINLIECNSDDECPDFEVCSISSRTGSKLCAGCLAVDFERFTPINPNNTRCDVSRPPCGRPFDFCSESLPCADGFECITFEQNKRFQCVAEGPCQCSPNVFGRVKPCTTSTDCQSREACSLNVLGNIVVCVSCDTIRNDYFFVPIDQNSCDSVQPLPLPDYAPGANGRSFDLCEEDAQCTGKRKCVQFRSDSNIAEGTKPCEGESNNLCFCKGETTKCTESIHCPVGEVCANVPTLNVNRECVSIAFVASLPPDAVTVLGDRSIPDGRDLTEDPCRFDWDCKGMRRCTHLTETYGGCAGRRACTCMPLIFPVCQRDTDCDAGERCANVVDGRTAPRCISERIVNQRNNLQRPGYRPAKATPLPGNGLTGDPCREDSDCNNETLSCRHFEEWAPACDGRFFCVCKRIFVDLGTQIEQPLACSKSADCSEGEACTNVLDSVPSNPSCLSRYAFEQESEVFEEVNPRSSASATLLISPSVLPSSGSFATPGSSAFSNPLSSFDSMPSRTLYVSPSATPSLSSCPIPSSSSSLTPSATRTALPSATPTVTQTASPSYTRLTTPSPTSSFTPLPTSPSTPSSTPLPTSSSTPSPTPSPTPSVKQISSSSVTATPITMKSTTPSETTSVTSSITPSKTPSRSNRLP